MASAARAARTVCVCTLPMTLMVVLRLPLTVCPMLLLFVVAVSSLLTWSLVCVAGCWLAVAGGWLLVAVVIGCGWWCVDVGGGV